MTAETRRIRHIAPDAAALGRRLLAETGVADGALAIARPEVLAAIAEARDAGVALAGAQAWGAEHCVVCGCTMDRACVPPDTGAPCHWVRRNPLTGQNLCSACAPYVLEQAHG